MNSPLKVNEAFISLLDSGGISIRRASKVVITLEAGSLPVVEVTYKVPVPLTQKYKITSIKELTDE